MCFSAAGSFAVSTILTGVGTASIAKNTGKASLMLAMIPTLFALQQMAEGIVWLTIGNEREGLLHAVSVSLFLVLAVVVWPTWFPLSLFRIETDPSRRKLLRPLVAAGVAVSAVAAIALIVWRPHAQVVAHSIRYGYGLPGGPWSQLAYLLIYIVPTVVPFFVSTFALARAIGATLLVALVTTLVIREGRLTSVWCFFAAVLSVLVVSALHRAGARTSATATPSPLPA